MWSLLHSALYYTRKCSKHGCRVKTCGTVWMEANAKLPIYAMYHRKAVKYLFKALPAYAHTFGLTFITPIMAMEESVVFDDEAVYFM